MFSSAHSGEVSSSPGVRRLNTGLIALVPTGTSSLRSVFPAHDRRIAMAEHETRAWEESLEEFRKHAESLPIGSKERAEAEKKVFALAQAIELRDSFAIDDDK
jgi:hypothetical protein